MSLQLSTDHTGRSSSGFTKAEMIHIHVGPQKEKFLVRKHLLLSSSSSIRETFEKEDNKERETGIISMPNEDPKTFSFALGWMYQTQGKKFKAIKYVDTNDGDVLICLKLWFFGSRLTMPELQDSVMRQLHAWRLERPEVLYDVIYSTTSDKDLISGSSWDPYYNKLARWILDMCAR